MQQPELSQPIFGNWYIDEKIGAGSFGSVYKIRREEFGSVYYSALKVIEIPQTGNDVSGLQSEGMDQNSISEYYTDLAQNFVKEIELLAALRGNSNVVSYEDHAIIPHTDGIGYTILIRMELLTPLTAYLSSHECTQKDVVRLGVDMCRALELCETKKIIHRDIKPDNIFIADSGSFKLGDFGVARQMEKTMSSLSQKGTYTYMAPEVFKGDRYDSTVDIYSLGIVLYRLLNHNRTPFLPPAPQNVKYSDRETAQIRRMRGDAVPNIPGIAPELNQIVLKACAFQPSARYQSAKELRMALEQVLQGGLQDIKTIVNPLEVDRPVQTSERPTHSVIRFSDGSQISVRKREQENTSEQNGPAAHIGSQKVTPTPAPASGQLVSGQFGSLPPVYPASASMLTAEQLAAQAKKTGTVLLVVSIFLIVVSALLFYYISLVGGLILFVGSIVLMVNSINKIRRASGNKRGS